MSDEAPAPRPAPPRRQPLMADVETLVDMGVLEEQPQPPPDEPPAPPPEEQANAAALDEALAGAGIEPEPADAAAIAELAKLDPAVVDAITKWVQREPEPTEEK
ncbi:hypothetical protein ADK52_25700 [Streptomyces sp. WM6372]|uniref:hypothetical protein n=1 Tax=Streptomyces sp. WM6372 TaxID=1415555 RepID=UPI0006AECA1D|nr:hypothetical protein [Streptomyces sp. WM6372]KOU20978.1 hypothetical protein ADK52_25700 [Streptomyces sp. WM6372]